ncbi:hypothetical protein ANO11243_067730 [Dothideomycetidae sp. 11243]|nr:hypothetical protein ANO11243_067730 [fungal sp. No.11243]
MATRVDGYPGSNEQYVAYLEQRLAEARCQNDLYCRLLQHQTSSLERQSPAGARLHDGQHTSLSTSVQKSSSQRSDDPTQNTGTPPSSKRQKVDGGFIICTGQPPTPKKKMVPRAWRYAADTLLAEIRGLDAWAEKMESSGLRDLLITGQFRAQVLEDDVLRPIINSVGERTSITVDTQSEHAGEPNTPKDVLLDRLLDFASMNIHRQTSIKLDKMIAHFQCFILLSACAVLLDNDFEESDVMQVPSVSTASKMSKPLRSRARFTSAAASSRKKAAAFWMVSADTPVPMNWAHLVSGESMARGAFGLGCATGGM